jgi:PAS domain S-box-containing protein
MNDSELDELLLAGLSDRCACFLTQGVIAKTDKRFSQIFGYDLASAHGLRAEAILAQAYDIEQAKAHLTANLDPAGSFISVQEQISLPHLVKGRARTLEGWLKRRDGSLFWAELVLRGLGKGQMSLLITDLSSRRAQSDAYRVLKRRFGAVFDQTYQFTGLLDADGNLLEVNQTALSFAGHTTEEVIGRPFWEARWWAVSPVTQEKLKAAIIEARKGHLVRDTVQNIGAEGKVVFLDFSIKPVKDDEGNVVMLIPEGRDITDRVQAQMESNEKTVALEQANRLLRESERLKSEFFANVSHELRTPLTLLLAPLDSLLSGDHGEVGPEQLPLLQIAHNNAARLLQMINGLLDFSKLEAEKVEVKREATDVLALVQALTKDFEPVMKNRRLNFSLQCKNESLWVEIDRYLFERIFFNLMSNAIKFTADGGSIKVSLSRKAQGSKLLLKVEDTGIGIAAADLPNLFQKFRQLEGSSVRRFEGTGLGLALAKEFCELLGGTIKVESRPQVGSAFTVELVAASAKADDKPRAYEQRHVNVRVQQFPVQFSADSLGASSPLGSSSPIAEPRSSSLYGQAKLPEILVAEDNEELAQYIKLLLKDVCRVHHVADGIAALAKLEECGSEIDLILSDVMMPRLDGLELTARVKADGRFSAKPLILLTALTHRDALLKGWQAGADDYLFKPFHPTELVARVKAALKNHRILQRLTAELVTSRDEAVRAYKFKSDFLSHMSHEIRTPMNAVIGMSDMLSRTKLSETQVRMLADIQYSADVLLELINDILDYSKIESGRIEIETIPFELKGLVEGCAILLAGRSSQKGINLTTSFEVTVPPVVSGDPARIRQVLLNFLSNAVKFTDKGSVNLAVTVEARDTSRVILRFAVTDSGLGMSEVTLKNLFQPFVQGDSSITRRFGGTGLGLAICRGLVERMGGRIGVESALGKGSTFWFTVPVALGTIDQALAPGESAHTYAVSRSADNIIAQADSYTSQLAPAHRPEKILVAEDNLMNQTLLMMQLREFGFEARAVGDGAEAVEAFAAGEYDAVFMDCQMPGLDGMAATTAIRALEETRRHNGINMKRVPIIAVTAHAMPSDRQSCLQAGMDDFLPKPITLKDLREVLERWLPNIVGVHENKS